MSDEKPVTATIAAGTQFAVASGEYSDYAVHAFVRALRDLDLRALEAAFDAYPRAVPPEWAVDEAGKIDDDRWEERWNEEGFIEWLVVRGDVERVSHEFRELTISRRDYSPSSPIALEFSERPSYLAEA